MATLKDIYIDPDTGDIELGSTGDLKVTFDDDVVEQGVEFRLKTVAGDYLFYPECGTTIEEFIGQPNTQRVGARLQARIETALTYDGFLRYKDFNIDVFPLSATSVGCIIAVKGIRGTFTTSMKVDLSTGSFDVTRVN